MIVLMLIVLVASLAPFVASAGTDTGSNGSGGTDEASNSQPPSTFTLQNPLSSKYNSVGGLIGGFVQIFSYLVIIFAVLAIVWTGLQFILARGNSDRLKELKNQLFFILIGVAVVIGARVIITLVLNTLQSTGIANQDVIQKAKNAALNDN